MIDIVSLHILKTGGMSFLEILKDQYDGDRVYRYTENNTIFKNIRRKIVLNTLPSQTKVLHGHFVYRDVEHIVKKHNSKVVTWFRDPVERVISRYYFLMKGVEKNPGHPKRSYKNDSLLDFANRPEQVNVLSRFVQGIDLEQLFFLGFLETFDKDMNFLAKKLNWKMLNVYHKNNNVKYKSRYINDISNELRAEIAALNKMDVELYNKAWKMKKEIKTRAG